MWIARKQSEELNHPWSLMTQPCPSHGIALACREVSCPKLPCSRRLMQDMKAQLPVSDGATLKALLAPELSAELVKALVVMALWASVQCHFLFLRVYLPRAMPPPKKTHVHSIILLRICFQEPQSKMLSMLQVYFSK